MTVAQTIAEQIGNRAFVMMGAKNILGGDDHLQFKIGQNGKGVTHVTVTLASDDTYTVKFTRVGRAPSYKITDLAEVSGVYVDSLKKTIEANTGLYLSL